MRNPYNRVVVSLRTPNNNILTITPPDFEFASKYYFGEYLEAMYISNMTNARAHSGAKLTGEHTTKIEKSKTWFTKCTNLISNTWVTTKTYFLWTSLLKHVENKFLGVSSLLLQHHVHV
jgi:hypothetical protein